MNRRAFLAALGTGAVGTVAAGQMSAFGLLIPSPVRYALVDAGPAAFLIEAYAAAGVAALEQALSQPWREAMPFQPFGEEFVDGARLGDVVNGATMTSQYRVVTHLDGPLNLPAPVLAERNIVPAMHALANEVRSMRLNVCAPLPLVVDAESAIATNPMRSLAVRAVRAWMPFTDSDPASGEWMLRFDFLGGRA